MTPLADTADLARSLFRDRLTISRREAAAALGLGRDYLDALVAEDLITCVHLGVGPRARVRFRIEDLTGFLASPKVPLAYRREGKPGRPPCPSTSRPAGRPTSTISGAVVTDIGEIREARAAARPKPPSGPRSSG
jgi:hypothetical protein